MSMKRRLAWVLQLLVFSCIFLWLGAFARQGRTEAFIGYSEEGGEKCIDTMNEDFCNSYLSNKMCRTSYVRDACRKTCGVCSSETVIS